MAGCLSLGHIYGCPWIAAIAQAVLIRFGGLFFGDFFRSGNVFWISVFQFFLCFFACLLLCLSASFLLCFFLCFFAVCFFAFLCYCCFPGFKKASGKHCVNKLSTRILSQPWNKPFKNITRRSENPSKPN